MTQQLLFERIKNINCSENDLINAIKNLGAVTESPGFWTSIAENNAYKIFHRRHCIFQLFYRHVYVGMALHTLAVVLQKSKWLTKNNIRRVEDIGGHIPVKLSFNNTVVVLSILLTPGFDNWEIYLSIAGTLDEQQIFELINDNADNAIKDFEILETGFTPQVLNSLKTDE